MGEVGKLHDEVYSMRTKKHEADISEMIRGLHVVNQCRAEHDVITAIAGDRTLTRQHAEAFHNAMLSAPVAC